MHRFVLLALAEACLLFPGPTAKADANPIRNPGFEAGFSGWELPTKEEGEALPEAAHTGNAGLKVTFPGGSQGATPISSASLPVHPNGYYEVSFWARSHAEGDVQVFLQAFDKNNAPLRLIYVDSQRFGVVPGKVADWRRYAVAARAPADAAFCRIVILPAGEALVEADLDDFEIRGLSEAEVLGVRLPPFPKSDPVDAYRETKIFDASGHFYRVPTQDWAGVRTRIASDPAWKAWTDQLRSHLDDWMAVPERDQATWESGYWHDYISPKDASRLTFTPQEPAVGTTLTSVSDPAVTVTPKIHGAWVYRLRMSNLDKAIDAARFYRLTGEPKYRDWAIAQIDFYAQNYEKFPPGRGHGGGFGYQHLDDATFALKLAQTAQLLWKEIPGEKKTFWWDHLFGKEADYLGRQFTFPQNIAFWCRSAEGVIALLYGNDELWERAIFGPWGLHELLERGVTSDYLWYEQSLGYNYYTVIPTLPLLEAAALHGRLEQMAWEASVVEDLTLAPLALRFPDGMLPNPAQSGRSRIDGDEIAGAAHLFPTRAGILTAGSKRDWDNLLDPLPSPPPNQEEGLPPVVSRSLESSQMAVLKDGPWQIYFHYGQLNFSHAQDEALNWEAYFGSTCVTSDTGSVSYGSPLNGIFYDRGVGNNVPLIDGEGQDVCRSGFLSSFTSRAVAATQNPYRLGWKATRSLAIEGQALVDRVQIVSLATQGARKGAPATLALPLHLDIPLENDPRFQPVPDFSVKRPAGFALWQDVTVCAANHEIQLKVRVGNQPFVLRVRTAGPFKLYRGSTPAIPPHRRNTLLIETQGESASFETLLAPEGLPSSSDR